MRFRRFLTGTAATAMALLVTTGAGGNVLPTTRASALAVEAAPGQGTGAGVPLQEFRTSRNAGWFYTLNPAEAAWAVQKFKFVRQGNVGIMRVKGAPGTTPVHRLRLRVGEPSYLLSIDQDEIRDDRFVDEGVVGYVDGTAKPGMLRLMRFSNHGQWRVALETRANAQRAAGYTMDASLGWVHP